MTVPQRALGILAAPLLLLSMSCADAPAPAKQVRQTSREEASQSIRDEIEDVRVEAENEREQLRMEMENARDDAEFETQSVRDELESELQSVRDEAEDTRVEAEGLRSDREMGLD